MTALAKLNFETVALPGLRVWGFRPLGRSERFGVVVQNERGAVELWSEPTRRAARYFMDEESFGGVEIHSPKRLHACSEPDITKCDILGGGPCWNDGSSLAYSERFLPLIRAGASGRFCSNSLGGTGRTSARR